MTEENGKQFRAEQANEPAAPPQETEPLVLPLEALDRTSLQVAGGKAANLGELSRAGLPVPPGFCVTTASYRRFLSEAGLAEPIAASVADLDVSDQQALQAAADSIHALFARSAMPTAVARAIKQAYSQMGQPAVAVRSSATAEDLPEASFAGQQETFLNVVGPPALLDAVQRCWASLWTPRAIHYRQRLGIRPHGVAMGVVVQAMVHADVSGVLFTLNPSTGDQSELVINASFGLGEAIVSGRVTPDTYVVDRASLATRSMDLGTKEVAIQAAEGGGTSQVALPEDRRGQVALPDEARREVASLGLRAEALFGRPQDVEWACAEGKCVLLQSRPVTAVAAVAPGWDGPIPGARWMRAEVVELLPDPVSPLFETVGLAALDRQFRAFGKELGFGPMLPAPLFGAINGYAYMRMDYSYSLSFLQGIVQGMANALRLIGRGVVHHWRDRMLPHYRRAVERWQALNLSEASDRVLLEGIDELAEENGRYWTSVAIVIGVANMTELLFRLSYAWLVPGGGRPSPVVLLRGFRTQVAEGEEALYALARKAPPEVRDVIVQGDASTTPPRLGESAAGAAFLEQLGAYLRRYGHQIFTLDFAEPTFGEQPSQLIATVQAFLSEAAPDPARRLSRLALEREEAVRKVFGPLDPPRRAVLRKALAWAQRYAPVREDAFFYVGLGWPSLRRMALELGRRLCEQGALPAAADVFYLTREELAAALAEPRAPETQTLAETVQAHKLERERRRQLQPPPSLPEHERATFWGIDLEPWLPTRRQTAGASVLRGSAVSPGRAAAAASLVRSQDEFGRMGNGTVLVATATTPAWTPLFARAAGLVTDIGGNLSHGSIVAREYGIPAVMGTGSATQRIAHGQAITVDGDRGEVYLAEAPGQVAEPAGARRARWWPIALAAILGLWLLMRRWRRSCSARVRR